MKEVDYIIVGLGIAGITFCEQLKLQGKRFVVFDPIKDTATAIAGGVVNPVVLKRFTAVWNIQTFLPGAFTYYSILSDQLEVDCVKPVQLHRILKSVQEQNDWLVAGDTHRLAPFLSSEILENTNPSVDAPYGFGGVQQVFRIDTPVLIEAYREALVNSGQLHTEIFEYEALEATQPVLQYKKYKARKVVFAEGAGAVHNPYFNLQCLIPKKGEYLIVKAPQWRLKAILKGAIFIIPLGDDHYKVGATFDHHSTECKITQDAKEELKVKVRNIMNLPFEVVDQVAGMRPTVKDRRPLLGSIHNKNLLFFNGLGTRGLVMAPWLAEQLYQFSENDQPIPEEINIKRFV